MRAITTRSRSFSAKTFAVCVLLVVATSSLAFYFYGPLRHARLGLIDDHEILRFLGPAGISGPADIFSVLFSDTEVGHWGEGTRLRPVYYFFRIIESAAFGDRAGLWYITRMMILVFIAFGLGFMALRALYRRGDSNHRLVVAAGVATLTSVLVVTIPSWTDIGTRLGPSEVYVALGITLFAAGGFALRRRPSVIAGWAIVTVGYLVIAGSKEDGLLFIVPLAVLFFLYFPAAKHRWVTAGLGALSVLLTAYTALGIVVGSQGTGEDMYGNGRRLDAFIGLFWGNPYLLGVGICLAVAIVVDVRVARDCVTPGEEPLPGRVSALRRSLLTKPHALAVSVSVFLVGGELYFYQNYLDDWKFGPLRYGFVSEIAFVFAVMVVLIGVTRIVYAGRMHRALVAVGVVALLAVSPLGTQIGGALGNYRALSIRTADTSVVVDTQIQNGVADLRSRPDAQALLLVDQAIDYERVFALPEFLAFYAGVASVFVDVEIPSESSGENGLTSDLSKALVRMQAAGKTDSGWRIAPDRALDPDAPVVCFAFNGGPSYALADRCDSLHIIG